MLLDEPVHRSYNNVVLQSVLSPPEDGHDK